MLQPRSQWSDQPAFDTTLSHLGQLFVKSFGAYLDDAAQHVGQEMAERILKGGPDVRELLQMQQQQEEEQKEAGAAAAPAGSMELPATP